MCLMIYADALHHPAQSKLSNEGRFVTSATLAVASTTIERGPRKY